MRAWTTCAAAGSGRTRSPLPRLLSRALLVVLSSLAVVGAPPWIADASATAAPYWDQAGSSPSAADGSASAMHMEVIGGVPHVAYITSGRLRVRRWDGTSWQLLGGELGTAPGNTGMGPRLAAGPDNVPVVAWRERTPTNSLYQAIAKRWTGSEWVQLGGSISDPTRNAGTIGLAVDSTNRPIVAWNEATSGSGSRSMFARRWDGTTWQLLGGGSFNQGNNRNTVAVSVTTIDTTPVVAWIEIDQQNNRLLYVASLPAATWSLVGSNPLQAQAASASGIGPPEIASDGTRLWLTWSEVTVDTTQRNVYVRHWNGSTWSMMGTVLNVDPTRNADTPSVTVAGGVAHVGWTEFHGAHGRRVFVARWTGSAWSLLGDVGVDDDWMKVDNTAVVRHDGTRAWVGWREGSLVRVSRWGGRDIQTGDGTLVPESDRSNGGFSRTNRVSGACTVEATMLWGAIDEDVDAPSSGDCTWSSSEFIFANDPVNAVAEVELTNARPMLFANRLRVRYAALKVGDRAATLSVELRRADGTSLAPAMPLALSGEVVKGYYDIPNLRLSKAEVDGLHARIVGTTTGTGTPTSIRVAAVNVDMDFVHQSCGLATCPPVRPKNVAPLGGTILAQPVLEGDGFADTDIADTHAASEWQVRADGGTYSAPHAASGTTATSLTSWTISTPLAPNSAYWWRTRYQDSSGAWSDWSDETRLAYDTTPPRAPENRRAESKSIASVAFTWDIAYDNLAIPGQMTYDVEAAPDGQSWQPLCDAVDGLDRTCTITPNAQATPTYFRVRARDEAGNASPWARYADSTLVTRGFSETTQSAVLASPTVRVVAGSTVPTLAATNSPNLVGLTGLFQFLPQGQATARSSMPPGPSPVQGQGWFLDELSGACVNDGEITVNVRTTASKNNGEVMLLGRLFETAAAGGSTTAPRTNLGLQTGLNATGGTATRTSVFSYAHWAVPTGYATGTSLYFEPWLEVVTPVTSVGGGQVVTMTSADMRLPQPGGCTAPPTEVTPAAATTSYAPPVVQATYRHTGSTTGHVAFEFFADVGGSPGPLVHVGYSAFELAPGQQGTYAPVGLPPRTTYHWRAVSEDRQGRRGGVSATTTYEIIGGGGSGANTTPAIPTLVAPSNGGSTSTSPSLAATFTDPDADVGAIEFEICSTPSCDGPVDPARQGTTWGVPSGTTGTWSAAPALPDGTWYWRARATDGLLTSPWSTTWSLTATATASSNLAPSVPMLVSPADGSASLSDGPTLVARFADPDAADTGRVEFQVCAVASCNDASDPARAGTSQSGIVNGSDGSWGVLPGLLSGTWYWRARNIDSAGASSAWSASRRLDVGSATMTITLSSTSIGLGPLTPGSDATGSTTIEVTSNALGGYTLAATDSDDASGLSCTCGAAIADWTGTGSTPTEWSAGTPGGIGITVRGATGGRLGKWGGGTGTSEGDHAANRYAGLRASTSTVLHSTTGYDTSAHQVQATARANVGTSQGAGNYTGALTLTLTANP